MEIFTIYKNTDMILFMSQIPEKLKIYHLLIIMEMFESLKRIRIKEYGWVYLKTYFFHMRDLIGVIKRENLSFQRILFYFLSKEIGIGAQNGLLKKIPIFKISMDGHIQMTSMVLSKKIGVSWIS
jgi:hypothetical protein